MQAPQLAVQEMKRAVGMSLFFKETNMAPYLTSKTVAI
jgi:hypothetical protein